MEIKTITQEEIFQAQKETQELLEQYKNLREVKKEDTLHLVKAFAHLVDLQNDFINQLITEGQVLADAVQGIHQNGRKC